MTLGLAALAGACVGAAGVWVVLRPRWALLLLLAVELSNASSVVGTFHGISLHLVVMATATASMALAACTGRLRVRLSPVLALGAVYVLAQVPSLLVATDKVAAVTALLSLAKDLWFLTVVVVLALEVATGWTLARVVVATMTVISALTLVNQFLLGNSTSFGGFAVVSASTGEGVATARHAGAFDDPNFWGRLLLLGLPLAVALVVEAHRRAALRSALLWAACLPLLAGGLYLTQSRGALIGLAAAVVLWMLLLGPRTRRMLLAVPVAAALLALIPGVGSRLATLGEVLGSSAGPTDYSLVEREATMQISLAMFLDNPGVGVGLGNIPAVWDSYSDRADIVVQRQIAPHNLYLQLAAEGGLVGLAGVTVFFVGVLLLAARVVSAYPVARDRRAPPDRVLAVSAIAALSGWAVASLFLHLSFLQVLFVVIALVAVLHRQVPAEALSAAGNRAPVRRPAWQLATGVLLLVAVTAATAATAVAVASRQVWVARVPVTVLPRPMVGAGDFVDPYSHEVITLPGVMTTYAAAIEAAGTAGLPPDRRAAFVEHGYSVAVNEATTTALTQVEVRAPRRAVSMHLAERVARVGTAEVNASPALSRLAEARTGAPSVTFERLWSLERLALATCVLALLAWPVATLARRAPGWLADPSPETVRHRPH